VEWVAADLARQSEVRFLADHLRSVISEDESVTVIHNAAYVGSWYEITCDGVEKQFAVNYLSGYLLFRLLLPSVTRSREGRLITVTSGSHRQGRMHWKDVNLRNRYGTLRAYSQSKLANVLLTSRLRELLINEPNVAVIAADPGLVNTGLGEKATTGLARAVWSRRRSHGVAPEEAAQAIVWLATADLVRLREACYWRDQRPVVPSRRARSVTDAARLWELSERMTFAEKGHVQSGRWTETPVPA
jgi:NAD(P)-dependent dehydrogenase (short-subunit alcohol dehydrogenase family)